MLGARREYQLAIGIDASELFVRLYVVVEQGRNVISSSVNHPHLDALRESVFDRDEVLDVIVIHSLALTFTLLVVSLNANEPFLINHDEAVQTEWEKIANNVGLIAIHRRDRHVIHSVIAAGCERQLSADIDRCEAPVRTPILFDQVQNVVSAVDHAHFDPMGVLVFYCDQVLEDFPALIDKRNLI